MKRVVVTGMSAITPIGQDWPTVSSNLQHLRTGIRYMPEWEEYKGLNTRLAAPVTDFVLPSHYTRKVTRSMGRGSMMAARVTELALEQAGLLGANDVSKRAIADGCMSAGAAGNGAVRDGAFCDGTASDGAIHDGTSHGGAIHNAAIRDGTMGIAYGSSSGSPEAIMDFGSLMMNKTAGTLNANTYIKMMAHTAPVNLVVFFGLKGRVYTTSSACTSGSQGIGYAFEAIRHGQQIRMVAGGTEELSVSQAAIFDTLFATSTRNDAPELTPRPFDRKRDGLVVGEGAATLILEELQHAQARGAPILAEVVGFGTNCDGAHVTQPSRETMRVAMHLALQDAGLDASAIGYVSAHGTSTERGDVAESHATFDVFGSKVPISAMKSFTGHTLGGCGSIEAWAGIHMMNEENFHATANLHDVDPQCADLDYIRDKSRLLSCEYFMSNNFAFGGINTSLIFKRWAQP
jgi:3-oxoacyl-[acyl-carrier-protein] synthase II